ncbi:hypothetical protein A9A89_0501 [Bifidobacterium psychraerophilum DSM 22366]|jgi:hypothetical protein|nr:hypothetical protein A9A89_0501 [Bifidobacterium psychraerophilum DSM 22366]
MVYGTRSINTSMHDFKHRTVYAVIQIDSARGLINLSYASVEGSSVLAYIQSVESLMCPICHCG